MFVLQELSERKLVVVSVSPQARASLAAKYSLTMQEASSKLTAFLQNIGTNCMVGSQQAHYLSTEQRYKLYGRQPANSLPFYRT